MTRFSKKKRGGSLRCGYCNTLHGSKRELFNLAADPGETENVVADRDKVAEDLATTLNAYEATVQEQRPDESGRNIAYDDEEKLFDQLEDLGYR